ncbi:MAG: tetratricopeptide repeat protein [Prevotella sp.]|nr:tetratricopeptide repeat protein [Prevotella sp.]
MKKSVFLSVLFCFLCLEGLAQGVLEVKNISHPDEIYASGEEQAALRVRCNHSIPLRFSSSMDKQAEPFKTDIEGSDSIYYIEFPTGKDYKGRILTIMSPGYYFVEIPLELNPKQLVTLEVTDPNSLVDAGCYKKHRNQGLLYIKDMKYNEAKLQFTLATECSDVDVEENQNHLNLVDTLISLRKNADMMFELLDYNEAAQLYNKIVGLNASDTYALDRYNESNRRFSSECSVMFKQAEVYYNDMQYDKAKELYQKIIDHKCFQTPIVTDRINSINNYVADRKTHSRVLTYEYSEHMPIGIHYGRYNFRKVGGYFHLNLNDKIFDAIRSECTIGDSPEAMIGFGWTIKIASPVWVHFGPGIGTKLYYGEYEKDKYPNEDGKPVNATDLVQSDKSDPGKVNFAISGNPEVGLTVKYSYFAIRATYIYSFAFKKELEDYLGKHKFMLGIGVAF